MPEKLLLQSVQIGSPRNAAEGLRLRNSERIVEKHTLQVLDSHFASEVEPSPKTACNPTHVLPATTCNNAHAEQRNEKTPRFRGVFVSSLGDEGFEPPTSTV